MKVFSVIIIDKIVITIGNRLISVNFLHLMLKNALEVGLHSNVSEYVGVHRKN